MFYWGSHLHLIHSPYHKGPPQWRNSLLQWLLLCWCPNSTLGPKDSILPQICGEPSSGQKHIQDNVKEARKEFFLKHSYNFVMEGTCNLLEVFMQMAMSTNLLSTPIYEIQVSWTGQDELRQVHYALRSLHKGLKFLHVVPPSESPKVMGLVGIHDLDALHRFSRITHCPWCGKEGQNEGTVINHLQMVHYRLGLVCNKCQDCPSTTSDTLCHHGWQDCQQPGEKIPNESVSSV